MMYFLDFDRTLFDIDSFAAHLLGRPDAEPLLKREPEQKLAAVLAPLVERGEFAFAPDELRPFVYPDVPEFLRMLGNEAVILTSGNPTLQKKKVENALAGIPRISALYTGDEPKGEFMRKRIDAYGPATFIDDWAVQLENMALHCPHVKLIQMCRGDKEADGRWPVVHSLDEL